MHFSRFRQNDASLVVAVLGSLDKIKSADISTHKKICRRILNNSKCLSSTDKVALLFSLEGKEMPASLKQMFTLNRGGNNLFFSLNVGQRFSLSMDSVYVYDIYIKIGARRVCARPFEKITLICRFLMRGRRYSSLR